MELSESLSQKKNVKTELGCDSGIEHVPSLHGGLDLIFHYCNT